MWDFGSAQTRWCKSPNGHKRCFGTGSPQTRIFKFTCPFPYWNCYMDTVNPYEKRFLFGDFLSIPKWSQTLFWIGLVAELSPCGNRPSLGIDFQMVSQNGIGSQVDWKIPIRWSRYGNREPHVLNLVSILGFSAYHFRLVIPIWKREAVCFESPYGNGNSMFLCGDLPFPISHRWGKIGVSAKKKSMCWCCVTQ